MEPLEEKAKALVENVKAQTTPGNRSLEIGIFVSQGLRGKEINLYEAYLLSGIKMEFRLKKTKESSRLIRRTSPTWRGKRMVPITACQSWAQV